MQNILVTNMHFKYLNRLHVMLGLSWKHSGAPWVMKWKKAIKRWVKTALGQSVTQTEVAVKVVCLLVSRLLLAGEVASFIGTEDAHCYTQKDRHHNHYAQDDSSNVDVIYKKKAKREIMALQGVFITCEKAIKLRTNFHHLRSTFGDPSLIPGSAVVFSSVLLPDRTEFLKINKLQWF